MEFKLATDMRYCVIGDPVKHSLSPDMQNAAFEYYSLGRPYGKLQVTAAELPDFCAWARVNLDGFNATIPHKERLFELVDSVDERAEWSGSVNTVLINEGQLYGYSTDGHGLLTALKQKFDWDTAGGRVLLIGAGGAARAVAIYLASRGVQKIEIVNRTLAKAAAVAEIVQLAAREALTIDFCCEFADNADEFLERGDFDLILQFTQLGLDRSDAHPFDFKKIPQHAAVFDSIYRVTPLQKYCRQKQIRCVGGLPMLLHQGAASFEIWTGRPAPIKEMSKALEYNHG